MNLLSPFGALWGGISRLRNAFYDRGIFRAHSLGARTISVGNLTAGGTGKTPVVAMVSELLADGGEKVCILTRGFGRTNPKDRVLVCDGTRVLADAPTGGDEPFELAERLFGRGVVIIADADRVGAAEWARTKFGITAFVLDDAFQHRKAKRDLDIVCIDATDPWGGGQMLPAGRLREPISSLARADAVVITRSEQSPNAGEIEEIVRHLSPDADVYRTANRFKGIIGLEDLKAGRDDRITSVETESYSEAFAFCGLGNPNSFIDQLKREGFALMGFEAFRDHHRYNAEHLRGIEKKAIASGAKCLLTTAKDATKLRDLQFAIPCYVMMLEVAVPNIEDLRGLVTGR